MRFALPLLALLALAASHVGAQPLSRPLTSITPPATLGPYTRGARTDMGEAGVAFQYSSSADSSFATVYFYRPAGLDGEGGVDRVIASEVREFREHLQAQQSRGVYARAEIAWEEPDTVQAGSLALPGYKLAFVYWNGGEAFVSVLNLYVAGTTMVKIRGTVPAEQFERTRLLGFAEVVAAQSVLAN